MSEVVKLESRDGIAIVTVDSPVSPNREYNLKSGYTIPFTFNRNNIADVLMHPRWLAGFIADGMTRPFPNIVVPGSGPLAAIDVAAPGRFSTTTGWPNCSFNFCAISRAMKSTAPPGTKPTTMRSGLLG